MPLSPERMEIVGRVVAQIQNGRLTLEEDNPRLGVRLAARFVGISHDKAVRDFFKEHIYPLMTNDELLQFAVAVLDEAMTGSNDILRGGGTVGKDLYQECAQRFDYANKLTRKEACPEMDRLNWCIYQNRGKSPAATGNVVITALFMASQSRNAASPDEVAYIVNPAVQSPEPPSVNLSFTGGNYTGRFGHLGDELKNLAEPAVTVSAAQSKKRKRGDDEIFKEARDELADACKIYQSHITQMLAKEFKSFLQKEEMAITGCAIADVSSKNFGSWKEDLEKVFPETGLSLLVPTELEIVYHKYKALSELNSILSSKETKPQEQIKAFCDSVNKNKAVFEKSADPIAEKWLRRIKIAVAMTGLGAIALVIHAQVTKGTSKFWLSDEQVLADKARHADKKTRLRH